MLLQLLRHQESEGVVVKTARISLTPGQTAGIRFHGSGRGLDSSTCSYMVPYVICNLSQSFNMGHYVTALSAPGRLIGASASWK